METMGGRKIVNKENVFIWSVIKVLTVVLLNPNFSSKTNVSYISKGKLIISQRISSKIINIINGPYSFSGLK
jgi:hypothetical protein